MALPALMLAAACSTASDTAPRTSVSPAPSGDWWLFDGHVDVVVHYATHQWQLGAYDLRAADRGQTTLERMAAGRAGGGFFTCGSPNDAAPRWPGLADCLAFVPRLAAQYADRVAVATTASAVRTAQARGQVAWVLSVEGGDQIDGDLSHLPTLRAAGVRVLGLVYDRDNDLGDGAQAFVDRPTTPTHGGLSPLGQRAVDEMARLGMIADVAHAAESTALAVAARSTLPVLATHTAAAALVPTPRNASDAVLRAIAATDGVAMVTFLPYLTDAAFASWFAAGEAEWNALRQRHPSAPDRMRQEMARWEATHPRPSAQIAGVADHIEYIARTIGVRHVGIGSDFDGMEYTIDGLEDHRGIPSLIAELERRGWSQDDLRAITSGNVLRVLEAADAAGPTP